MPRRPRPYTVDQTTVYFPETVLDCINGKNRFAALKEAKRISLKAVAAEAVVSKHDWMLGNVAKMLKVEKTSVLNYTRVWYEFYDFDNLSAREYADMIRDIVKFY